ncbi:MAG: phosphate ABC transporter permease subunit PstC, partial [Bacteroidota bacterium]
DVYNPESGAPPVLPADSASAATPSGTTPGATAEQTAKTNDSNSRLIVGNDYPILNRETPIKLSYLYYRNWQPNSDHPRYGIFPILVGTLKTTLIALLIAAPLSILAALYTAFFAPKRFREILKPIIEILAGFPSVVVGFFCLMTVASLVQTLFGIDYRLNAFVGGIGLALAVIPIIYTISDDALRAVPGSLREAALAIGASEWQAAYQVMLPAATPGIFAALLLGLGRAFGETMIALMATGNAGTFSWNFFEPVRTFAATIGAEMGEVQHGSPHYQILFLLGVILFIFSFAINLVTEFYVKQRLIKKFRGAE